VDERHVLAHPAGYTRKNAKAYLDLDETDLSATAPAGCADVGQTVLKEWLATHQNDSRKVEAG